MGLDQYARVEDGNKRAERADTEFAYWRKHPNLQGWMYRWLCGDDDIFRKPLDKLAK